jgi:hypothetical protein
MTPDRPPADQAVRDRVTTDVDTTFLLEAGAGTGKTTVLVNRVPEERREADERCCTTRECDYSPYTFRPRPSAG